MKKVRTRYAPSPTGYLHIGGARTALFNYLFAKHYKGDFIFRIEDTDIARNVEGGENSQLDNLAWLGIIPDESTRNPQDKYGKYRQSEKLDRYLEIATLLIEQGKAYKAYDTSEEIEKQRQEQEERGIASFRYDRNWLNISEEEKARRESNKEYTIRLALKPNFDYKWSDIVRGEICVNTNDIGDWVIIKQDGYPTYNFAVVIDDHDMEISHVLRGEEHITNTPKQLAVYDALGWETPQFGHLTIITNMEGKKLSKRDLSLKQFIEDYKNEGYNYHAIFNFLALLGWTHPEAKEILSHDELIAAFDEKRLSKSPSKFDIGKMEWFSKEYMKNMPNHEIAKAMNESSHDAQWLDLFIEAYKTSAPTIKTLKDDLKIYENHEVRNIEKNDVVISFASILNDKPFTIEAIQESIKETQVATGKKGKDLFMPIRLATTYQEHGPELARSIFLFGEDTIKARLK